MSESSTAHADQAVFAALAQSRVASSSASGQELIDRLTFLKSVVRQAEHDLLYTVAQLDGRGEFTDRGIRTASAVADLVRCTRTQAQRLVATAASAFPTSLTGEPLEPRLPATATALGGWEIDRAHAEVIQRALDSDAAGRLEPQAVVAGSRANSTPPRSMWWCGRSGPR
jgi:5-methylcytosine-specific restriction protein A